MRVLGASLGQHPLIDLHHYADFLGQAEEIVRRDEAALRMLPPNQRLDGMQAVAGEREDRLVVELQARQLDGLAQPRLDLELVRRLVELDAAAAALGLVYRDVRFPDQVLGARLAVPGPGDPDAGLEGQLAAAQRER